MRKALWICIVILGGMIGLVLYADYNSHVADFLCDKISYYDNIIKKEQNNTENIKQTQYDDIRTYRKDLYNEESGYFPVSSGSTTYENSYRGGNGKLKIYGSLIDSDMSYQNKTIASLQSGYLYYDKLKILIPQGVQGWSYIDENVDQKTSSGTIDQKFLLSNKFFSESIHGVGGGGLPQEKKLVITKFISNFMSEFSIETICDGGWPGDIGVPAYTIEKFLQSSYGIEQYIAYVVFDNESPTYHTDFTNRMCFNLNNVYYMIFLHNIDRDESEKIFNSLEILG